MTLSDRLAVMNADGRGLRRLPQFTEADPPPAWSADGRRLIFSGSEAQGRGSNLRSVAVDGPAMLTRITGRSFVEQPAVSSRGALSFTDDAGIADRIFVRAALGGPDRRLVTYRASQSDWSPGGGRLVLIRHSGRARRIYSVAVNGTGSRRLSRLQAAAAPIWSPCGRRIAFSRRGEIYVLSRNGGRARRLFPDKRLKLVRSGYARRFSWQPAG